MTGLAVRGPTAFDPLATGPAPPGEPWVRVVETHTGVVVLLGDRAFKTKKPVRLPFVDLSTRADRLRDCRAEIRLNRRFAPDVYLGLLELRDTGRPPGTGEPVVAMRRMPLSGRLSTLLGEGRSRQAVACVDAVARRLAAVHLALPALEDHPLHGTMSALWAEGRDQLAPFTAVLGGRSSAGQGDDGTRLLDDTARLAEEYLDGCRRMLDDRELRGLVRDGHGDLLADDIFMLDDGPRILDCLEFAPRLRHGDVLADAAFLAMDLEHLGAPGLARRFLDQYRRYSGYPAPRSLEHHYVAYRAFVRSKVQCFRQDQGDPAAAQQARDLLELCRRHLHSARVLLVLVGGLPGSGKSTLAQDVAALDTRREWVVLGSDAVRKELAGIPADRCAASGFGAGLYSPEWTGRTYSELERRAGIALSAGASVVLDASWTDADHRAAARRLAAAHRAVICEIRCEAPPAECRARLRQRARDRAEEHGGPFSDADEVVHDRMAVLDAPWPEASTVRTDRPVVAVSAELLDLLDACART